MNKSILRYFIVILFVTLCLSSTISGTLISNNLLKSTEENLLYSLKLINYSLERDIPFDQQLDNINPLAYSDNTRISIIGYDGVVVADTYKEEVMENHLSREEVKEAIEQGIGYATRQSATAKQSLLYVAYDAGDYIIRISIPYRGILDHLPSLIPALSFSIVTSLIISFVLSIRLANKITYPITKINENLTHMGADFRIDLPYFDYDEFNEVSSTLRDMSHRLRKSLKEVQLERMKIDEILSQMNEGFVLLDERHRLLSINDKAISILGAMNIHDIVTDYVYYPELLNALTRDEEKQEVEIKVEGLIYVCYINKIELGTTLLFVDMTLNKKIEKMRREFFSNVSHELKTPLTSIKGYSELLAQGLVSDENQKITMLNKIQNEVNNMSRLINDILLLSKLENMELKTERISVHLGDLSQDILDSFIVEINKRELHVSVEHDDIEYICDPQQMYTVMSNLISNAIKYNVDQGYLNIKIFKKNNHVYIQVSDSGIGISHIDQTRIFERFYRVDKGRSRQLGGTGLGLAIVKHTVSQYKGTIDVTSVLHKGTTITVKLPL